MFNQEQDSRRLQPGEQEFKHLLANRDKVYQLYQLEDFRLILLPYLQAELSNRLEELTFNKYSKSETRYIQGKAQALHAVINLPQELKDLKSMEEQEDEMLKKIREEKYEEM